MLGLAHPCRGPAYQANLDAKWSKEEVEQPGGPDPGAVGAGRHRIQVVELGDDLRRHPGDRYTQGAGDCRCAAEVGHQSEVAVAVATSSTNSPARDNIVPDDHHLTLGMLSRWRIRAAILAERVASESGISCRPDVLFDLQVFVDDQPATRRGQRVRSIKGGGVTPAIQITVCVGTMLASDRVTVSEVIPVTLVPSCTLSPRSRMSSSASRPSLGPSPGSTLCATSRTVQVTSSRDRFGNRSSSVRVIRGSWAAV